MTMSFKFAHELTWEDWVGYEEILTHRERCIRTSSLTSAQERFPFPLLEMVLIAKKGDAWDRSRRMAPNPLGPPQ